jgi:hypothetical protein
MRKLVKFNVSYFNPKVTRLATYINAKGQMHHGDHSYVHVHVYDDIRHSPAKNRKRW